MSLAKALSHIDLKIDNLLLDANNPRFSELGEELISIPENRFAEEKIQAKTLEKMKATIFNVGELKDTIKTVGFLPMDRVIVRPWKGGDTEGDTWSNELPECSFICGIFFTSITFFYIA